MSSYEEHDVVYGGDNNVHYLAAGPTYGPLIIFMHGWPGIGKTWHNQLDCFASLGFRVIAPDMPGYGKSTARKVQSDYSLEKIVEAMLAVLADAERDEAVWIGHDWGAATLWTLANTHPHLCRAVVGLTVPYGVLEHGLDALLKTVDREFYPKEDFPSGQWDYMVYYQQSFDKAAEWMNSDIRGFLKALMQKPNPSVLTNPSPYRNVVKNGGFMGGTPKPPSPESIPDGNLCMEPETFEELVRAMEKTTFYTADSWYLHHDANADYNKSQTKHDGNLHMPVLFIGARYDSVCQTYTGRLTTTMRRKCQHLSESVIEAGHWVASEAPDQTNAVIARWLVEEVTNWWPGFWTSGLVKK